MRWWRVKCQVRQCSYHFNKTSGVYQCKLTRPSRDRKSQAIHSNWTCENYCPYPLSESPLSSHFHCQRPLFAVSLQALTLTHCTIQTCQYGPASSQPHDKPALPSRFERSTNFNTHADQHPTNIQVKSLLEISMLNSVFFTVTFPCSILMSSSID